MKFSVGEIPERLCSDVTVGDVYPAKGGRGDTKFWVVVSLGNCGRHAYCLGINGVGAVVSTVSFGVHALAERPRVGFCPEIGTMDFSIQWEPA